MREWKYFVGGITFEVDFQVSHVRTQGKMILLTQSRNRTRLTLTLCEAIVLPFRIVVETLSSTSTGTAGLSLRGVETLHERSTKNQTYIETYHFGEQ